MNKIKFNFGVLALFLGMITGCGGTGGSDPLNVIAGPPFPQLDSIVSGVSPILLTQYSSASPFWIFGSSWLNANYLAPANGVVSEVGLYGGLSYIVIIHSGRLSTKITGLSVVNVRSGDTVVDQQTIGVFASTPVQFEVMVDGTPVCPLSYMSQTFRTFFLGYTSNPCLP